jgi:hypothetical protein
VSRLCRTLVLAVVGLALAAPAATAVPRHKTGALLGTLWKTTLEMPVADSPFGDGSPCIALHGVLAPFGPPQPALTCTAKPGTKILVVNESTECSTVEPPPFFGANEQQLRDCARAADAGYTRNDVTLDGRPVPVSEVETSLLHLDLRTDNIFGVPAQRALSVAHGWAALLHPITPGTHTVGLRVVGTDVFGNAVDFANTTTIIVTRWR